MAKAGFLFLIMAVVVPAVISRSTNADRWHFQVALIMYALAMFGVALLWAAE